MLAQRAIWFRLLHEIEGPDLVHALGGQECLPHAGRDASSGLTWQIQPLAQRIRTGPFKP